MTTNDAAERLREAFAGLDIISSDLDAALAAEYDRGFVQAVTDNMDLAAEIRRATVERIRAAVDDQLLEAATLGGDFLDSVITWRDLTAILDKEAER